MIPQIWFEKMEALDVASEGTWPRRGDPCASLFLGDFVSSFPSFLQVTREREREAFLVETEGGRPPLIHVCSRDGRTRRAGFSIRVKHLPRGSRIEARVGGAHAWIPRPREGRRGSGGRLLQSHVIFLGFLFSIPPLTRVSLHR